MNNTTMIGLGVIAIIIIALAVFIILNHNGTSPSTVQRNQSNTVNQSPNSDLGPYISANSYNDFNGSLLSSGNLSTANTSG